MQLFSGIPGGIGAHRGLGDPNDPRRRYGAVYQEALIPGLIPPNAAAGRANQLDLPGIAAAAAQSAGVSPSYVDEVAQYMAAQQQTRQLEALADAYAAAPGASGGDIAPTAAQLALDLRNRPEQSGGATPMSRGGDAPAAIDRLIPRSRLAAQAQFEGQALENPAIASAYTGQWVAPADAEGVDAAATAYQPSNQRRLDRKPQGLAAVTLGEQPSAVLVDPQIRAGRLGTPAAGWSLPQSGNPVAPMGRIGLENLVVFGDGGAPALPVELGEYAGGIKRPRGEGQSDNERYGSFTSEDPTLGSIQNRTPQPNPYGTVTMPAIDARGRWTDNRGRPLQVTVDPSAVVQIRTADADAARTSDQAEEITLGRLVQEAMAENRTPVLGASRLNELAAQGRARLLQDAQGKAYAEVDLYDVEDHAIVKRPDGSTYLLSASQLRSGAAPATGEQLVGVKPKVPVLRTETVYLVNDSSGEPLTATRQIVNPDPQQRFGPPVETRERLYRIGSALGNDTDAIREAVAPYIPGSGFAGQVNRPSRYDLAAALNQGTAAFSAERPDPAAAVNQLGLPLPDAGNTYVTRGGQTNLLVPRLRADGTPVGDFLVQRPGGAQSPVGPTPFLRPPAGATEEQARIIGGIRRKGEQRSGESFFDTLKELAAGGFMQDPDQASGLADILKAVNQGVPAAAIARPAAHVTGPMAPDSTSLQRIAQAQAERRGTEVDLFTEQPLTPLDQELTARNASAVDAERLADFMAGNRGPKGFQISGGPELPPSYDAFDQAVAKAYGDMSPAGQRVLADLTRRVAGGREELAAQTLASEVQRPVTTRRLNQGNEVANQLWLRGVPAQPRYAQSSGAEPTPEALNAPPSGANDRAVQLELPTPVPETLPAGVPAAVREGLTRQPGTPAYEGARRFLTNFMGRLR